MGGGDEQVCISVYIYIVVFYVSASRGVKVCTPNNVTTRDREPQNAKLTRENPKSILAPRSLAKG